MPRRWGVWRAWGRTVGTAVGAWFVRPESSRTSRSEARRASRAARWRTAPACTVGTARSVWSVVRGARWTPRVVRARCVATGSSAPTAACAVCARLGRSHTTRRAARLLLQTAAPPAATSACWWAWRQSVRVGSSVRRVLWRRSRTRTAPSARTVRRAETGTTVAQTRAARVRSVGQARGLTQIVRRAAAVRPGMRGQKARARCVRTARLRTRRRRRASGAQTATLARLGCARSVRRGASRMVTRRCARTARLGLRARAASVRSVCLGASRMRG